MANNRLTTIIYGLGKRFYSDYFSKYLMPEIKESYVILGVSDKIEPNDISRINYPFIERSSRLTEADLIMVTSDKYYDDIKRELFEEYGIKNCLLIDDFEKRIVEKKFKANIFDGLSGVEVGGPSFIFRLLYRRVNSCDGVNYSLNTLWWKDKGQGLIYEGKKLGNIIVADAVDLSLIKDNAYDFCISSNNLEHIANPIKALYEFKRITKKRGIIIVVVPCKNNCFDHNRDYTNIDHLISDYKNCIKEDDISHLNEIMQLHDFEMDQGVSSAEEFAERAKKNFENRCLHHHVFNEITLKNVFEYVGLSVVDFGKIFADYYIVGTVK